MKQIILKEKSTYSFFINLRLRTRWIRNCRHVHNISGFSRHTSPNRNFCYLLYLKSEIYYNRKSIQGIDLPIDGQKGPCYVDRLTLLQVASALASRVPRRVDKVPVVVVNVSVVDSNVVILSDKSVMSEVQDVGQVSREYVCEIDARATESILPSKELILISISSSCLRLLAN